MIGEISALGGSILPIALSQSKQHTGSYRIGFIAYAVLAVAILLMLRIVSRSWTRSWVGGGGRAILAQGEPKHVATSFGTSEGFPDELPVGI